ncbi:hypothetical protein COBT_002442 [Conglomerata obtusa]
MTLVLEKEGTKRSTLDIALPEAFTQKIFRDLIADSHASFHDYLLGRVYCRDNAYTYYDARQLCKYIYEMQISASGRKIAVKNFKDPISQNKIENIHFFKLRCDSETPLRAEYVGDHDDFLDSYCFRSKMFYQEDPLYALSVNFCYETKRIPLLGRKHVFSLFVTIIFILMISTFLIILMEKDKIYIIKPRAIPGKVR